MEEKLTHVNVELATVTRKEGFKVANETDLETIIARL